MVNILNLIVDVGFTFGIITTWDKHNLQDANMKTEANVP